MEFFNMTKYQGKHIATDKQKESRLGSEEYKFFMSVLGGSKLGLTPKQKEKLKELRGKRDAV